MQNLDELQQLLRADKDLAAERVDPEALKRLALRFARGRGITEPQAWARNAFRVAWGLEAPLHRELPTVSGARFEDARWDWVDGVHDQRRNRDDFLETDGSEIVILNKARQSSDRRHPTVFGYVSRPGLPNLMLGAKGHFLFIPVDAFELSQAMKKGARPASSFNINNMSAPLLPKRRK